MRFYLILLIAAASLSCGDAPANNTGAVNNKPPANKTVLAPVYDFQIIKEYPHDPRAFTQGLEFHEIGRAHV